MDKKTSAFAQIPIWLINKLTGNEIKLFLIMYNGWRMMKNLSNGNTYFRSYKKLKEDLGIKSKNNNKIIDAIRKFEELGILRIERSGKKTNHYEFNEFVLFHTNDVPETGIKDVPETGTSRPIDDVPETGTIYKNKENNQTDNTCMGPNYKNEDLHKTPVDISINDDLIEILNMEPDADEVERQQNEYLQWIENNTSNGEKTQRKSNNDYVTWAFDKYDDWLDKLFKARSTVIFNHYETLLIELTKNLERERFTESQWNVILKKFNRWEGIECTNKYSGTSTTNNDNSSNGETKNAPAPAEQPNIPKKRIADDDNEWIIRQFSTDEELIAMGFTVEEPMVEYNNASIYEAERKFSEVAYG